jgi:hypothetical protein
MNTISQTISALRSDQRGNVMMIFGFALIPMVFATGMGIDYARAMKAQTKLNAAADAAALAAVTQPMMLQTNAQACDSARDMFTAQAGEVPQVTLDMDDPEQFWITLEDNEGEVIDCESSDASLASSAAFGRTVRVSYRAQSFNFFGGILGSNSLTISGSSESFAAVAPDIDFYLMVDMSQSMLLPATSSGLTAMINATKSQGGGTGCAFACHQTETRPYSYNGGTKSNANSFTKLADDISSNPIDPRDASVSITGYKYDFRRRIDNYQVARNLNLTLRTDLVKEAVADLTGVAETSAETNGATYRMGLTTFDRQFKKIWPTTGNRTIESSFFVDSDLDKISTYANNLEVEAYYMNNKLTSTVSDTDTHTRFHDAFTGILNTMPDEAGTGEETDEPQAILFLITDGMWDRRLSSGNGTGGSVEGPIWNVKSSGTYVKDTTQSRVQFCNDVKSRNIRIAVLYTQYLPSSASDSWSITNVKTPYLQPTDKLAPALQACASTGLYYKVTTDDDISAALTKLFQKAVATARLTR